jgi:hypothetical protein
VGVEETGKRSLDLEGAATLQVLLALINRRD